MRVLAIETSCDETSAAIVCDGRTVLSNIVSSQVALHALYGGVVPEIASRQHVRAIVPVVRQALAAADVSLDEVDAIAATHGPGLAGSLLVGFNAARAMALARDLPFIPVNHLAGHLYSVWLTDESPPPEPPPLPLLALVVSGGHTELVLVSEPGRHRVVGRTRDDAAGEAFDKVGRLLGLPYPGGPAIERAATRATAPVQMPRAWLGDSFDFSFSGLKTAALQEVAAMALGRTPAEVRGVALPRIDAATELSDEQVANLAGGFQHSVVDVLVKKTVRAASALGAVAISVVGGVAANRSLAASMVAASPIPVYVAPLRFSTDNAAMIAAAAYFAPAPPDAEVEPSLGLEELASA